MQAYLAENKRVLELDDTYRDVDVVTEELTLKSGRSSQRRDGGINLLVTYAQEFVGVVELKRGELPQLHLQQLTNYLQTKEQIVEKIPDILPDSAMPEKWIGVLADASIAADLAEMLLGGYVDDGVPIAALKVSTARGSLYWLC